MVEAAAARAADAAPGETNGQPGRRKPWWTPNGRGVSAGRAGQYNFPFNLAQGCGAAGKGR